MSDPLHTSSQESSISWNSRWQKKHAFPANDSAHESVSSQDLSFEHFLEAVIQQMHPEGRAQHQAGMHRYLRTLLPDGVTLADLAAGWQVLAQPQNDTNSEVAHRRKTCAELAAIAVQFTNGQGHLASAVSTWQAWLNSSQRSTDPRLTALRSTFARELAELQKSAF
ncbi:hypothetical protein [Ktedonospora formicarum]|uniref:Uncharacterized protein n=1 Tax=Ktedonospora formicarum TaxID=2778364 RepID=A0A8J3IA44_9CHLR|nr:hypothetical protein [Ktedonospora formicarum]GHO48817.1 hypothetical protein KSX_69800 [Ktedonospora formicarum]